MTESEHATGEVRKGPSPFALLGAAQFLSQFADSVFMIVLIWLLLDLTGSKSATGLAALVSYLPASGGILYAFGALTAPALTGIAFLCATAAALFNPARDSILPSLRSMRSTRRRSSASSERWRGSSEWRGSLRSDCARCSTATSVPDRLRADVRIPP